MKGTYHDGYGGGGAVVVKIKVRGMQGRNRPRNSDRCNDLGVPNF